MTINERIQALDWHREPYGLYEPIEYTLASGGKRLRPMLAMLGASLFGGNAEEVAPAALAIEVFHNFTLLHDDVMDHAAVRRGRPTVHVRWNENVAILSGDQMLIEAYKLLGQVAGDRLPVVLSLFNQMATEICEGQQMDMEFESREEVTLEEYMQMIRLKTAVLLATALKIGAYIAGASEPDQNRLYQFGIAIGLAFQIQDDLLDVYGDPLTFGKAIGGDICEKKKTYMLLKAMEMASAEQRAELSRWLNDESATPPQKIEKVTALYDAIGVREKAEQLIEQYTLSAKKEIQSLPHNQAWSELIEMADKLVCRNK